MRALITGVFGQDGSYLSEILANKGYEIFGIVNTPMSSNSQKIAHELKEKGIVIEISEVDLLDYEALKNELITINPDEIYHLAAQHVSSEGASLSVEKIIFNNNITATANILDISFNYLHKCKVLTAGSCLMYDGSVTKIQDETTPFCSNSYYGIAKITENMLVNMYRAKGLFACTAILYNHESHRRASKFVTQKIAQNMRKVKNGEIETFTLGNLDGVKDWGYAKDYAYGMYLMLQHKDPEDFILATNTLHSIRDFVMECAKQLNIENWEKYVKLDEKIVVRTMNTILCGDYSKAEKKLGWKPKVSFEGLVSEMLEGTLL